MIKGYSEGQGNVVGRLRMGINNWGYYIVFQDYKPTYQVP